MGLDFTMILKYIKLLSILHDLEFESVNEKISIKDQVYVRNNAKKGKLSASLFKVLTDYYSAIPGIEQTYINARWEKWKHGRDIIIYLIRKDNKTVGWIIYNKTTSTIEEILVNSGRSQALLRFQAVDALIDKESLVLPRSSKRMQRSFIGWEITVSDPPGKSKPSVVH